MQKWLIKQPGLMASSKLPKSCDNDIAHYQHCCKAARSDEQAARPDEDATRPDEQAARPDEEAAKPRAKAAPVMRMSCVKPRPVPSTAVQKNIFVKGTSFNR